MHAHVLAKVVVPTEVLAAQPVGTLVRCGDTVSGAGQRRRTGLRTLLVGVDAADVPLEMLPALEVLVAAGHLALVAAHVLPNREPSATGHSGVAQRHAPSPRRAARCLPP